MKVTLVLLFAVASVLCETYEDTYDNFDISELFRNQRLLLSYTKCLMDQGPCTPEVKKLREKLPEALATRCSKCTEQQKRQGGELARELRRSRPELWTQLVQKYDPQGQYQQSFQDFLAEPAKV